MTRRLVVADTGPLNYLVLIEAVDILPGLFERVFIPAAVRNELAARGAPPRVRNWIVASPAWLEIRDDAEIVTPDAAMELDEGERAALALARSLSADLVLMDDRAGVAAARSLGLRVTGTLGVLDLAARRGLIDLGAVVARLRATNFRYPPEVMEALLARHKGPPGR